MTYIEELARRLTKAGLTKGDLARATGIDRPYIARLFNGRVKTPTEQTINRLECGFRRLTNAADQCPGWMK